MQITDTIADLLTRIRNANSAKHATVDVPASNMKKSIAQILVDEGYIKSFQIIDDGKQGIIRTLANINTRVNLCTTLTNENVASRNNLTVRTLYAKALCLGITAVLSGTYALFMCEKL